MSMRSTSSECTAGSWRRVRGRGQRGKDAPTRPQHVRSACSQGRTQNSHSGSGSAAVRPAGIAASQLGGSRASRSSSGKDTA
jgi:hypothetical protein